MATARPLPETGQVFLDARGGDRALRVSWHTEAGLVVLSLWHGNVCSGSFRLAVDEVPDLIDMLREGLDRAYDATLSSPPRWLNLGIALESVDTVRAWTRSATRTPRAPASDRRSWRVGTGSSSSSR